MNTAPKHDFTGVPVIDIDPFALDVLRDPISFNAMIRETAPIVWLSAHGTYGVGRYEELGTVLRDKENFTSAGGAGLSDIRKPGAWRPPGPIVEVDPPAHTQVRSVMNQIISPRVIRGWKQSFELEAEKLCEELLSRGIEFDAVTDLIERYVFKVFPDALGVRGDREKLLIVGNHNFNAIGPQNELFRESQAAQDSVSSWFEYNQTREAMVPGGFGELIFAAEDSGALPPGTASPMLRTLLRGGTDTTISTIGSTFRFLAQDPGQWKIVQLDPNLIRLAFEEALRLESPTRTFFRTTASHVVEFGECKLRPDTKVQIFLGAANRDPRKWSNPDDFDASRKPMGHLGFGSGIHNCLGQMIARMESECLLGSFMRRVDKMELTSEPRFRLNNALRTLETLPLRVALK